eukprot:jgi/Bigna1/131943/aug1.16_g6651
MHPSSRKRRRTTAVAATATTKKKEITATTSAPLVHTPVDSKATGKAPLRAQQPQLAALSQSSGDVKQSDQTSGTSSGVIEISSSSEDRTVMGSSRSMAADNPYLERYWKVRRVLEDLHWIDARMQPVAEIAGDLGRMQKFCLFMETCVTPLRNRFAWGIPNADALRSIRDYSQNGVVEIGAGTGYWCNLLTQIGVKAIAYDIAPPDKQIEYQYIRSEKSKISMASRHPDMTLLLCWPPQEEDIDANIDEGVNNDGGVGGGEGDNNSQGKEELQVEAAESASSSREANIVVHEEGGGDNCGWTSMAYDSIRCYKGRTVVYVGEWEGQTTRGCKYGENAGKLFQQEMKRSFRLVRTVKIPTWPFASDDLKVFFPTTTDLGVAPYTSILSVLSGCEYVNSSLKEEISIIGLAMLLYNLPIPTDQ